jgi:hypothetical protein
MTCAAENGVLPHPTRYLGADDEEKLSRDEAPRGAAATRDREQSM